MRIKKFNELFDSEEVKIKNEIPIMQGFLNGVSSKTIHDFSKEDLADLAEKFNYYFPVLYQFNCVKSEYDSIIFDRRNDQWYVSISINIQDDKYGIGILYRHIDSVPPKNNKDPLLKTGLDFRGKQYTYYYEWNEMGFDDIINITKKYFIPLIDRLGFKDDLSIGKKISIQRFN